MQGKDSEEALRRSTEGFLETPHNCYRQEAYTDVDRKDANPDLHNKRNSLVEGSHDDVEVLGVAKVLRY